MQPADKAKKNRYNKDIIDMDDVGDKAKSFIERFLGDVSKTSATKQIILGSSTGWLTGFLAMRIGKVAALALGGGIILLEVAHEKGYIKINWDKVNKKLDKVTDAVEEKITGEAPSWMDKVERYVDRQVDKAESSMKSNEKKAKSWFSKVTGHDDGCRMQDIHIFLIAFAAGVAIGVGTA